jgi:uncharacterized repeat protein (TIGR01451 family)
MSFQRRSATTKRPRTVHVLLIALLAALALSGVGSAGSTYDLVVTKTANPASAKVGDTINYSIAVINKGPATATGVTVTDALPDGVNYVSASTTQGTCSGKPTVTCSIGTLANEATATVTIVVKVTKVGPIKNTASVSPSAGDSNTANYSSSATTAGTGNDLAVTKTASPATVKVGRTITYAVAVTNKGPGPANGVTMTDVLPAGVSYVSAATTRGTCSGSSTVTCSIGTIPENTSATVTIVVKATAAGTIKNTAEIGPSQDDPDKSNNSASATTTVTTGTSPPPPPPPGACTIKGTPGNDILTGTSRRDIICGLGGNDVIRGGAGADIIRAGNGRDIVYGGRGNDVVQGGLKADTIYGSPGSDRLYGGAAADRIYGGPGADLLYGGRGFDLLNGGLGVDACQRGPGSARLVSC